MKPSEILEKYGLKTDVKSIKQRIDNQEHFDFLYNLNERTNFKDIVIESTRLMRADLDLLCEMAERVEKVEELLGLYQKFFNILDEYDKCATIQQKHDILNQFNDIEKQIKTLEEELK